jgi:hypothetical protein
MWQRQLRVDIPPIWRRQGFRAPGGFADNQGVVLVDNEDCAFAGVSGLRSPPFLEHLKPSEESASIANVVQEAFDALRRAGIRSARIGRIIDNEGVVLVDNADRAFALTMLARAGFTAVADSL